MRKNIDTLEFPKATTAAERSSLQRINQHVWFRTEEGISVIYVHGMPWHRFAATCGMDRRIVGATLVMAGLASTVDVVQNLQLNRTTLYFDRQRLASGGIQSLAQLKKGPKGPTRGTPELKRRAKRLLKQDMPKIEIARVLGLGRATLHRMLRGESRSSDGAAQLGLSGTEPEVADRAQGQGPDLPDNETSSEDQAGRNPVNASATPEPVAPAPAIELGFEPVEVHPECTTARDLDRSVERVFARFGVITEAAVKFVPGKDLRYVGSMLIIPALVVMGFFAGVEAVYGRMKNGFYGLRHTIMTLALMLTLRIKRAEHLSGKSPAALGRLLGLDRAPEVKTLRRKLREIASFGRAHKLLQRFGRMLAERNEDALGFLYVDGHVRAYSGKRKISKAYMTRLRLALPATSDFWVHDANGEPLFVVTGEAVASLTRQLMPILDQVRGFLPAETRATVVFDRGGWSPKLFRKIIDAGFDILTYRKGRCPRYPAKDFSEHRLTVNGREVSYRLRDGVVRLGAGLQLRCVVRDKNGHQTHVVTNRRDLSAAEVAYRMFERWRQENYFKYARDEFALDALDTYEVELDDAERTVPNPARKKLDKTIRTCRRHEKELEAELGRAIDRNDESHRPTARGFKISHSALRKKLSDVRDKIKKLGQRRRKLPPRVPLAETVEDKEQALKLEVERKHFMNGIKMAVYRAETALFRMLAGSYRRNENEGRALLREAFRSSGSLEVKGGYLHVTLDCLSAPRRTRAIAALCAQLNETDVRIPGASLRLRFAVQGDKCLF